MLPHSHNLIEDALELSQDLALMADSVEAECEDDGCAVLAGVMRDCAYKIRGRAEQEREAHRMRGLWESAMLSQQQSSFDTTGDRSI